MRIGSPKDFELNLREDFKIEKQNIPVDIPKEIIRKHQNPDEEDNASMSQHTEAEPDLSGAAVSEESRESNDGRNDVQHT